MHFSRSNSPVIPFPGAIDGRDHDSLPHLSGDEEGSQLNAHRYEILDSLVHDLGTVNKQFEKNNELIEKQNKELSQQAQEIAIKKTRIKALDRHKTAKESELNSLDNTIAGKIQKKEALDLELVQIRKEIIDARSKFVKLQQANKDEEQRRLLLEKEKPYIDVKKILEQLSTDAKLIIYDSKDKFEQGELTIADIVKSISNIVELRKDELYRIVSAFVFSVEEKKLWSLVNAKRGYFFYRSLAGQAFKASIKKMYEEGIDLKDTVKGFKKTFERWVSDEQWQRGVNKDEEQKRLLLEKEKPYIDIKDMLEQLSNDAKLIIYDSKDKFERGELSISTMVDDISNFVKLPRIELFQIVENFILKVEEKKLWSLANAKRGVFFHRTLAGKNLKASIRLMFEEGHNVNALAKPFKNTFKRWVRDEKWRVKTGTQSRKRKLHIK